MKSGVVRSACYLKELLTNLAFLATSTSSASGDPVVVLDPDHGDLLVVGVLLWVEVEDLSEVGVEVSRRISSLLLFQADPTSFDEFSRRDSSADEF